MAKLALMWGPIYHPALPGDNRPQQTDEPARITDIPESRLEGWRVVVNTSCNLFRQVWDQFWSQSWPSILAGNFSDLPITIGMGKDSIIYPAERFDALDLPDRLNMITLRAEINQWKNMGGNQAAQAAVETTHTVSSETISTPMPTACPRPQYFSR